MANELEDILSQLQNQNQQLQNVLLQKQTLSVQGIELDKALEALEKVDKEEVFKSIGPILVRTKKEDVKKEIQESKEEIELRIKTLEKEEKRLKDKIKENQQKFQSLVPQGSAE